jgi:hypothetical protein
MAQKSVGKDPWAAASWEGAARANLLAGARLSLKEKLAWLEEMGRLAERLHGPAGPAGRSESRPEPDRKPAARPER